MQIACEAAATRMRQKIKDRINELNPDRIRTRLTRIFEELPRYYEAVIKLLEGGFAITPRQPRSTTTTAVNVCHPTVAAYVASTLLSRKWGTLLNRSSWSQPVPDSYVFMRGKPYRGM